MSCIVIYEIPERIDKLEIALRVCYVTAEILVLIATWFQTYSVHQWAKGIGRAAPLTRLIFRDGTIYFSALVALNIAAVVLWTRDVLTEPRHC
ncbi:hypothetical protein DAEQUDRAFT_727684 [Daedalea quercina L-15889]|uniref:Uncharacterized protein n=1 Tax=Daedalea quercina L-15889 TaxID=1314783 RepID=A0A165PS67_9APHY|nr:hypothetical protein DAEQUDRAFT_727684 [Daedalea quercina L-15889]